MYMHCGVHVGKNVPNVVTTAKAADQGANYTNQRAHFLPIQSDLNCIIYMQLILT